MGYESREFGTEPLASLELIDETISQALATAVPNARYAVRDVILDDARKLVVIEHEEPVPVTAGTLYREMREKRPLEIISSIDTPLMFGLQPAHLKIARWYNHDMFEEYRDQSFEPVPRYRDLLDASVATFELQFLVPKPVISVERDQYPPEYHDKLVGFAQYDLNVEDDSSYRTMEFVVPDFRKLFAARRAEMCEIVAAYDRGPQEFARDRGMDLYHPTTEDSILLYEIEKIMILTVVREQSLAEAVHEYLSEESLQCSREMTMQSSPALHTGLDWQRAHTLLTNFVTQINASAQPQQA